VTTTAPQALLFMNSAQGRNFAGAFAERLDRDAPVDDAYRIAFGRKPDRHEQIAAEQFLRRQQALYENAHTADAGREALTDLCQSIMSLNEFIYVE
jgi:hypothetical protein